MPAVPIHQFINGFLTVSVNWNRTDDLATFDNPFPVEQIGHRLLVLVDVLNA